MSLFTNFNTPILKIRIHCKGKLLHINSLFGSKYIYLSSNWQFYEPNKELIFGLMIPFHCVFRKTLYPLCEKAIQHSLVLYLK